MKRFHDNSMETNVITLSSDDESVEYDHTIKKAKTSDNCSPPKSTSNSTERPTVKRNIPTIFFNHVPTNNINKNTSHTDINSKKESTSTGTVCDGLSIIRINNVKTVTEDEFNSKASTSLNSEELKAKSHNSPSECKDSNSSEPEKYNFESSARTEDHVKSFLDICKQSVQNSQFEERLLKQMKKLEQHLSNCDHLLKDKVFLDTVENAKRKANLSAARAVSSFKDVYMYTIQNKDELIVDEDDVPRLRKLEKMMQLLTKRIEKINSLEVHGSENSSYMMADRYMQRLMKVHKKYCEILHKDPYSGRVIYEKVVYTSSKYKEINKSVSKFCKSNKFPTYYDIEKCIRCCMNKSDTLQLSDDEIKLESRRCFEKIGNLLQLRRKRELYDYQSDYIKSNTDPASTDTTLRKILGKYDEEGSSKMNEIINKYTELQDRVTVDTSEDSQDSYTGNTSSE